MSEKLDLNAALKDISDFVRVNERQAIEIARFILFQVEEARMARGCECSPLIVDLISADCKEHDRQSTPKPDPTGSVPKAKA